jgi:trans-2,3-dihydro-3-hydroxyanthranilate isomerase
MHTASRRTILRSIAALLAADFARGDTKHSRRFPFVQWDVFSKVRLAGNPLVVFPEARGLSDEEMQAITREIHQQETTFVIPREPRVEDKEGIRVRIFLPTKEVPFAGHPSLGTAMALQALWKERNLPLRKVVRLALNVGQVPVTFRQEADGLLYGEMEQPDPQFSSAHDPSAVAPLLGLQSGDIDTSLPIQLVSTGLPYVLVPLKSRDAISKISIDWTRALPWLERVDPDAMFQLHPCGPGKERNNSGSWNLSQRRRPGDRIRLGASRFSSCQTGTSRDRRTDSDRAGRSDPSPQPDLWQRCHPGWKSALCPHRGVRNPGRERRVRPVMDSVRNVRNRFVNVRSVAG